MVSRAMPPPPAPGGGNQAQEQHFDMEVERFLSCLGQEIKARAWAEEAAVVVALAVVLRLLAVCWVRAWPALPVATAASPPRQWPEWEAAAEIWPEEWAAEPSRHRG